MTENSVTLKIAVLKCDEWTSNFREEFGGVADQYTNFLEKYKSVSVDKYDGFVITGSKHDAYSTDPLISKWIEELSETIRLIDEKKKKLWGVCFGHQIIAQALGGKVENIGWNLSHQTLQLSDTVDGVKSLRLLSIHQDQVTQLPTDCEVWASNERCKYQGLKKGAHILTIQAHPELTNEVLKALLKRKEEIIPGPHITKALQVIDEPTDNELFAKLLFSFLLKKS